MIHSRSPKETQTDDVFELFRNRIHEILHEIKDPQFNSKQIIQATSFSVCLILSGYSEAGDKECGGEKCVQIIQKNGFTYGYVGKLNKKGKREDCFARIYKDNNLSYTGPYWNDMADTRSCNNPGTIFIPDTGSTYTGPMKEGLRHGTTIWRFIDDEGQKQVRTLYYRNGEEYYLPPTAPTPPPPPQIIYHTQERCDIKNETVPKKSYDAYYYGGTCSNNNYPINCHYKITSHGRYSHYCVSGNRTWRSSDKHTVVDKVCGCD